MSKSQTITTDEKARTFSARFLIALLLVVAGIGWLVFYYAQARGNPLAFPPVEGSPKANRSLVQWGGLALVTLLLLGLTALRVSTLA